MNRIACFLALINSAQAAVTLTFTEGNQGSVVLEIEASGTAGNGQAYFMAFGTTNDSFLASGQGRVFDNSISPFAALGGSPLGQSAYSDVEGVAGFQSLLEFQFSNVAPPESGSELSELNGSYELSDWSFANFVPGEYSLSSLSAPLNVSLEVSGSIDLVVVPEPGSSLLVTFALLMLWRRTHHRE